MKQTHAAGRVQAPKPRGGKASRRSRRDLWLVAAAVVLAAVVAGVLIAVNRGGSSAPAAAPSVVGTAQTEAMLGGIPQGGTALGSPRAPVTLVEYADLQCPVCARWADEALPTIVRDYVRPGKARLVFRGLTFLGPDSEKALRAALAAAPAGKFWNVVELLFRNQGEENGGWVTDGLLRGVVTSAGLEPGAIDRSTASPAVGAAMEESAQLAAADGVPGTPTFMLGRTGDALSMVHLTTLDPRELSAAIDATLTR